MKITIGPWIEAPARTERDIFAIGDIHGAAQKFAAMHGLIERIVADERLADPQIVHLGDYIDRGPQSLLALRRALTGIFHDDRPLPGNHEQFLRAALETEHRGVIWLWFRNGGDKIAIELGINPDGVMADPKPFLDAIRRNLGDELLERFMTMPNHVRHGRFLFVHAGIHPGVPLDEMLDQPWKGLPQSERAEDLDPLWIRGPFLTHDGPFPEDVVVVHGHTIMEDGAVLGPTRISLDTGAFWPGSPLSAVHLQNDRMRLLQTSF